MRKYFIYIVALSAIFNGCVRNNDKPQNECKNYINYPEVSTTVQINVDINKIKPNFWYDSIFSEYQYVQLETNDDCLIGSISKIIQYDSLFFVGDFRKTRSIFIFNNNGSFIAKISSLGSGPMEYVRLTDFTINKRDRLIELLADSDKKLIKFDFYGRPISEHKLDFNSTSIARDDNGYFLYTNGKKENHGKVSYMLKRINEKYHLEETYLKYRFDCMQHRKSKNCYFSTYESKGLVCPMFSNYIYELKSNTLVPRYHFNFGIHTLRLSETFGKSTEEINTYIIDNQKIHLHTYAETKMYLFLTLIKGDRIIKYIYNKQNPEKSQLASIIGRKLEPCYSFSKLYKGDGDNSIISVIEPVNFINCKKYLKSKDIEINNSISRISEFDNPILVIAKE